MGASLTSYLAFKQVENDITVYPPYKYSFTYHALNFKWKQMSTNFHIAKYLLKGNRLTNSKYRNFITQLNTMKS